MKLSSNSKRFGGEFRDILGRLDEVVLGLIG